MGRGRLLEDNLLTFLAIFKCFICYFLVIGTSKCPFPPRLCSAAPGAGACRKLTTAITSEATATRENKPRGKAEPRRFCFPLRFTGINSVGKKKEPPLFWLDSNERINQQLFAVKSKVFIKWETRWPLSCRNKSV